MIKNFGQFIAESEDKDFSVADLFSALTRNYESKKTFYTDLLQFKADEERRGWGDLREKAQLEKSKVEDALYKLNFTLDEKKYALEINFALTYNGKKERDEPEPVSDEESRLNVVLEKLNIKKIRINSSALDYVSSSPTDSVRKACERFMVKMLSTDYDTLGEELYSMEQ